MYFELNGKTYRVSFSRIGKRTFARLLEVTPDGLVDRFPLGTSAPHYTDKFEKSRGRKIALADLIWQTWGTEEGYEISKEDRAKIWKVYFEKHNK